MGDLELGNKCCHSGHLYLQGLSNKKWPDCREAHSDLYGAEHITQGLKSAHPQCGSFVRNTPCKRATGITNGYYTTPIRRCAKPPGAYWNWQYPSLTEGETHFHCHQLDWTWTSGQSGDTCTCIPRWTSGAERQGANAGNLSKMEDLGYMMK